MNTRKQLEEVGRKLRFNMINLVIAFSIILVSGLYILCYSLGIYFERSGISKVIFALLSMAVVPLSAFVAIVACLRIPDLHLEFNLLMNQYLNRNSKFKTLIQGNKAFYKIWQIFFSLDFDTFLSHVDQKIEKDFAYFIKRKAQKPIDSQQLEFDEQLQTALIDPAVLADKQLTKRVLKAIRNYAMTLHQKQGLLILINEKRSKQIVAEKLKIDSPIVKSKFDRRCDEFNLQTSGFDLSPKVEAMLKLGKDKKDPAMISTALSLFKKEQRDKQKILERVKSIKAR